MNKVIISKRAELAVRGGHPWIYKTELKEVDENIKNGDIVTVKTMKDKFLGSAFYNENSKITLRMISTNANDIFDEKFWKRRCEYAIDYRLQVMRKEDYDCVRLIFGEADQLPGLTVDRFGTILSVQILSLGIELRKKEILDSLIRVLKERNLPVTAVYERNDVSIRKLEGMEEYKGFYKTELLNEKDETTKVRIYENGIKYDVDIENGQKTGFFLDQKLNRKAAASIAKGKKVLDCFTHTGAFALNAAKGGAKSVIAIDVSQHAVDMATHHAKINELNNMKVIKADVFEYLTNADKKHEHDYDYIILDPPAFTKSGSTVHSAYRGYKEINYRAMKLLPRGGYLATCSCSHFMKDELFIKMIKEAARDAQVTLRLIESRTQSPDHPMIMTIPETFYLKFYIFQII